MTRRGGVKEVLLGPAQTGAGEVTKGTVSSSESTTQASSAKKGPEKEPKKTISVPLEITGIPSNQRKSLNCENKSQNAPDHYDAKNVAKGGRQTRDLSVPSRRC